MINEFFNNSETRALWFCEDSNKGQVIVMNKPPATTIAKSPSTESPGHLYMLKLASAPVNPSKIKIEKIIKDILFFFNFINLL
jgi:hypothetical protein